MAIVRVSQINTQKENCEDYEFSQNFQEIFKNLQFLKNKRMNLIEINVENT